jgi:3-oxoacyl-[acyl-carrier protein] reductase
MGDEKRFSGRHVLITGGARGIGYEIAQQFSKEGAILSIFDFNKENLERSVYRLRENGSTVYAHQVDVSNQQAVQAAVEKAESVAPIEVLINNAGIAFETPFLNISAEEWKQVLDINLTGMFYVAQAVCRKMAARKKGAVVNMSSKNGIDGEFGYAHYNASKAGVSMLTKTMSLELAHLNIRVNAVCPGYIQTPMSMEIDPAEFTENFVRQFIPVNRPGTVQEVAPLFLFLASDESSFITGQTFVVDGGQLAGQKPSSELLQKIEVKSS